MRILQRMPRTSLCLNLATPMDPGQYRIFMDMLKTIAGMDIVVNGIEGERYQWHVSC